MFKQFLQQIPGADWFMIASLAMFLLFFICVGFYLLSGDRNRFDDVAQLPLKPNS